MTDLDRRLANGPLRVRSVWSPEAPERLGRRLLERRRLLFALDALAACACALILVLGSRFFGAPGAHGDLPAMTAATSTTFSDGSIAAAASPSAQIRVEEDSARRVVARLTGGARFDVVPNPQRSFEVQARDVRVRVLGTVFAVEEVGTGQTRVVVERGRVEVAWLGGKAVLVSGQSGTYPPVAEAEKEGRESLASEPADPASPASGADSGASTGAVRAASSGRGATAAAPSRAGWRDYARTGDYGRAYEELHGNASHGPDGVRDDAGDLLLAADVARLSAHPDQAVAPLRGVYERHAGDRRAPVAAFTLGRVLVDDLGRPAEAAAAFEEARRLWPEGPLAEDALAREADACERAGRRDRARALASEYAARYPRGRHLAAMREMMTP